MPPPWPHCATWGPSSPSPKGADPPIFGRCPLWHNGWMLQDGTWHGGGPWPRPHCAKWGPSSLPQKGGRAPSPIFGPFLLWANGIKMPLGMEVGISPSNFVLDRDPAPSPKRGGAPQFLVHFYCGQMAGCIKMLLGMEVGLSSDDIVLHGDPAPLPKKGAKAPSQFSAHVYCGQTAAWIKMAFGVEMGLGPGHIVLDGDQAPPSPKGGGAPNYRPMSIAAKLLDASRCHLVWRPRRRRICVRWGPSPFPKKGAGPPVFGRCPLWPNGCMDQDATWYGGRR